MCDCSDRVLDEEKVHRGARGRAVSETDFFRAD
jgi:hypothetical protein